MPVLVRSKAIPERWLSMAKTFLPTLVYFMRRVCVYIAKYRATILTFLPEGGEAALNAVVDACEDLLALTEHPIDG